MALVHTLMSTVELHAADFPGTLFPLDTNRVVIEHGAAALTDYIYNHIASDTTGAASFLAQERVYACKHDWNLRRTQKLDPVAEYFIYDVVYRNRSKFRPGPPGHRRSFGYYFASGVVVSPSDAYRAFKAAIHAGGEAHTHYLRFDVANYFNSLYHHDLAAWFDEQIDATDALLFGKFLRQINAGRSVDCLTQGIVPTKIIGSHFLRFIERAQRLRSPRLLRFMDDVFLFADSQDVLRDDFIQLQKLLGERGLSVNPAKTQFGEAAPDLIDQGVDALRADLVKRKRKIFRSSDDIDEEEELEALSEEEEQYLMSLLESQSVDEEDAELVLALMREHGNDMLAYLAKILPAFPYLARNIAIFCDHVTDHASLLSVLRDFVTGHTVLTEFQLFWITRIAERQLLQQPGVGRLLQDLYDHPAASRITRAKILEIPSDRYGLDDLRREHLRNGASDWLTWSSIVGTRGTRPAARNHLLGYVANSSPINRLIANVVRHL